METASAWSGRQGQPRPVALPGYGARCTYTHRKTAGPREMGRSGQDWWCPTPTATPQDGATHDVHEGEDVVLHVLLAMEAHHRGVHHQQHLDAVAARLGVPPLPLAVAQLLPCQAQQVGEVAQAEGCQPGWEGKQRSDPQERLPLGCHPPAHSAPSGGRFCCFWKPT